MNDHWRDANNVVQLVGGRWTLSVLGQLLDEDRRYQELHDAFDRACPGRPDPSPRAYFGGEPRRGVVDARDALDAQA